jgi:predicted kinase
MLVVMAGLPGTGKSTLAARLARELGAVALSKDEVRAALFPRPVLDYSVAQDDVCMAAVYDAAAYIVRTLPGQAVILDGRTFLRPGQVRELLTRAAAFSQVPRIIECVCGDDVAWQRLEGDRAGGKHPARNRSFDLYRELQSRAEAIEVPHLVLDTGNSAPEECVQRCLEYLRDT